MNRVLRIKGSLTAFIFLLVSLLSFNRSIAGNEVIPAGSLVIDVGSDTPTIANALKPYGLVYALLKNQTTPVKWVINPNKIKDGIDFTVSGRAFKGGPFVVPANFRTTAVNALVATWVAKGVRTYTTTVAVTVPVYVTMTVAPQMVLDAQNGSLAVAYLNNAEIPANAYIFKTPAQLNLCDDIYVMPHADPTWSTHSNLYNWIRDTLNGGQRGAFWLNCHAVSVLENTFNPSNPSQQINTLMRDPLTPGGLAAVPFATHANGTLPPSYIYQYPTDPVMQFIGKTELASQNGSEQIYLPKIGWRPTTKICVFDGDHPDIPSLSPGQAAQIAYGPGYGVSSYGKVMVQAGHSINKGTANDVAAQCVFLNFLFVAAQDKAIQLTYNGVFPYSMNGGVSYPLSITANGYSKSFTYQWTSSVSGIFSNPNSPNTTFTPGVVGSNINCGISCKVLDACGRFAFYSNATLIVAPSFPPVAVNDVGVISAGCLSSTTQVTVNVLANDTSTNGDPLTLSLIGSGNNGTFVNNGGGSVTYYPNLNFTGSDSIAYQICDTTSPTPLCASAWIRVFVGSYDSYGCSSSQFYGFTVQDGADSVVDVSSTGITNPDSALDVDDGQYALLGNPGVLTLNFNDVIPSGDTLFVYWARNAGTAIITITQSIDNVTYTNPVSRTLAAGSELYFYKLASSALYVKITRTSGTPAVDAVEYRLKGCVSKSPVATPDNYNIPEDAVTLLDVLANDYDPQNQAIRVKDILIQPTRGKVSVNMNNTITYVSNKDVNGADQFSYRIIDAEGYMDTATVSINILADGCAANQYRPVTFGSPTTVTLTNLGDAFLQEDNATKNNNGATFDVGKKTPKRRRTVIQFQTSSIPAGSVIQSANMVLTRTGGDRGANVNIGVYALTNPFVENQVTWNRRNSTTNWTTVGGDYSPSLVTSTIVPSKNGKYTWGISTLVQNWVNGTTNNGMELIQMQEATLDKRQTFASLNNGTAGNRPVLTVSYTPLLPCTTIVNRQPLA